jgi:hypothetical protein
MIRAFSLGLLALVFPLVAPTPVEAEEQTEESVDTKGRRTRSSSTVSLVLRPATTAVDTKGRPLRSTEVDVAPPMDPAATALDTKGRPRGLMATAAEIGGDES